MSNDLAGFDASLLERAEALDTLTAILPFDRRDKLAELRTDDDIDPCVKRPAIKAPLSCPA